MCGIFGYVGEGFTTELLLAGIRRLEYRGYDSWGMAFQDNGSLIVHREKGNKREVAVDVRYGGVKLHEITVPGTGRTHTAPVATLGDREIGCRWDKPRSTVVLDNEYRVLGGEVLRVTL